MKSIVVALSTGRGVETGACPVCTIRGHYPFQHDSTFTHIRKFAFAYFATRFI
jgi:hypothetical protein